MCFDLIEPAIKDCSSCPETLTPDSYKIAKSQHRTAPEQSKNMAEHGSVEQELWNIFTFYTLHGNPMYPDLLKSSQFSKLCKQCLIMKTPEMPNGLPGAVINVVYIGKCIPPPFPPLPPSQCPNNPISTVCVPTPFQFGFSTPQNTKTKKNVVFNSSPKINLFLFSCPTPLHACPTPPPPPFTQPKSNAATVVSPTPRHK